MGAGAAAFLASLAQGPPESVPAVALGWPLILHLERAALIAMLIAGLGGTLHRLLQGDSVTSFSAPGGPGVQVADDAAAVAQELRDAIDEGFREVDERLSRLEEDG